MNTAIKISLGIGAVGSITGGGITLNKYLSNDSIQNKLENHGFKKLEKTSSEWANIFTSYQTVSKKDAKLKFGGVEIAKAEDLQKRCEEILNRNNDEDNETKNYFLKGKKWCVVPTTVFDSLKGRKILGTDDSKDSTEDQADWNKKIQNYTQATNTNKITGLTFTGTPINTPSPENRNLIRKECKKLNEKKSYEDGYEEAINKSKTWCTIEKNN